MHHWLGAFLVACALAVSCLGCESGPSMEEISQINDRLTASLKAETGFEPLVSYYQDGSYVKITVRLQGASTAQVDKTREQVEAIVKRHHKKVSEIVVESAPAE